MNRNLILVGILSLVLALSFGCTGSSPTTPTNSSSNQLVNTTASTTYYPSTQPALSNPPPPEPATTNMANPSNSGTAVSVSQPTMPLSTQLTSSDLSILNDSNDNLISQQAVVVQD